MISDHANRGVRMVAAVVFASCAWPFVTWSGAFVAIRESPLFQGLPASAVIAGAASAIAEMWREFVVCGIALTTLAVALGIARGVQARTRSASLSEGVLDVVLTCGGLLLGIALELPAVLRHPMLFPVRDIPVLAATLVVGVGLLGIAAIRGARARARFAVLRHVASIVAVVAIGWAIARPVDGRSLPPARDTRVLLGIDSLSQLDDVELLRLFVFENGGAWYERAVTPGLLTNAVWTSILASRPASETGVYFVYQAPDWTGIEDNLVQRAQDAGLTTVSFFSDQFTTHVGSDAGFDVDRSGPRGWKQVATATVKDASVLLPVLLPRLPRIPGAATPRNQSGTYTYVLDRELREILAAGGVTGPAFVAAHLDYLHQPRYPSYSELTSSERARVLVSTVRALSDDSMHWQYPAADGEPLDVYRWKLHRMQRSLAAALRESGFLEPGANNQLVLFSDHGPRSGITEHDFGREMFFRVVLATFGTPTRASSAPISLLDVDDLLGLPHAAKTAAADPVVEYVNVSPVEWEALIASSRPLANGTIALNDHILRELGRRLLAFRPYTAPVGYFPAPVGLRESRTVAE